MCKKEREPTDEFLTAALEWREHYTFHLGIAVKNSNAMNYFKKCCQAFFSINSETSLAKEKEKGKYNKINK